MRAKWRCQADEHASTSQSGFVAGSGRQFIIGCQISARRLIVHVSKEFAAHETVPRGRCTGSMLLGPLVGLSDQNSRVHCQRVPQYEHYIYVTTKNAWQCIDWKLIYDRATSPLADGVNRSGLGKVCTRLDGTACNKLNQWQEIVDCGLGRGPCRLYRAALGSLKPERAMGEQWSSMRTGPMGRPEDGFANSKRVLLRS